MVSGVNLGYLNIGTTLLCIMIRILLIAFKKVVFSELEDHVPFHVVGKHAAYQVPLARSHNNWTLRW